MKKLFQSIRIWADDIINQKGEELLHLFKYGTSVSLVKMKDGDIKHQLKSGMNKCYIAEDLEIRKKIKISTLTDQKTLELGTLKRAYIKSNTTRLETLDGTIYMVWYITY